LGGTERFFGELLGENPDILKKVAKVIELYYQHDLAAEEVLLKWGTTASRKYVDIKTSKKVRKAAEPFITWLENASDEESDEDEDDE